MTASLFRFLSRQTQTPVLAGPRHLLRFPRTSDFAAWRDLRRDSRQFLEPWEPSWTPDELTGTAFRHRMRRYEQEFEAGLAVPLFLFSAATQELLGGLTIGLIRRGVAQSCMIGYWMGEKHAGQGHMSDALKIVTPYIFNRLQLHRIEAACIPDNHRSIRLLEKNGFRREGLLREYLKINGQWRDHCLYARVAGDRDPASFAEALDTAGRLIR